MITLLTRSAAVFAAVMLAAGVARSADLSVGLQTDLLSLDPHHRYRTTDIAFHRNIYEALVSTDERQQPTKDGLAQDWKLVDDTTWEFKLRKGVKFHDGSDFTADDVVASLNRIPKAETTGGFTPFISQIAGTEIVDPHTIRIKTKGPGPTLLLDISIVFIIPKKIAETASLDPSDFNSGKAVIGTGPYKFVSWQKGDRVVLDRNPNYWGKKPEWDKVTSRIIGNDAARVAALLSGDVDVIERVPTTEVASFKKNPKLAVHQSISNRVMYLYVDHRDSTPFVTDNQGKPLAKNPLQDVRVREAISKAIDRKAIVDKVMENLAIQAGQVLPDGFFGVSPKLKPEKFDPKRAQALLKEAGYPEGFKLTLHGPNNRYVNDAKVALAVAQMLTRVGIKTEVDTMPANVFFKRASNLEFSVNLQGWGATGEASAVLRPVLVTYDKEKGLGAFNISRYSNPKVDALVAQAVTTMDDKKRGDLLAQATEIAIKEYGVIPLHYQLAIWATKAGLNYAARADEMMIASSVTTKKK